MLSAGTAIFLYNTILMNLVMVNFNWISRWKKTHFYSRRSISNRNSEYEIVSMLVNRNGDFFVLPSPVRWLCLRWQVFVVYILRSFSMRAYSPLKMSFGGFEAVYRIVSRKCGWLKTMIFSRISVVVDSHSYPFHGPPGHDEKKQKRKKN